MAYRDPYMEQPGRLQQQPRYHDSAADFDPFSTAAPHQTYDQGPAYDAYGAGYTDDPNHDNHYPPERSRSQYNTHGGLDSTKETHVETGGVVPHEKRTARALRNYRYNHHGALWTKGGRGRCFGRFCCCTIMVVIFVFICILLSLALWIRPPNITIGNVDTVSKSGSAIQLVDGGIQLNLGINISVNNPNYFSVKLKQVKAEIFYPINGDTPQIGHGLANDVVFNSHEQTNWTFPFTIDYQLAKDPQSLILKDLAAKCGVGTNSKKNLDVNYKITIGLQIAFVTISPVIANSLSFMCPIDAADIEPLLKSTGLGDLLGII